MNIECMTGRVVKAAVFGTALVVALSAVFGVTVLASQGTVVVSSTDLVEKARELDGQTVEFAGEVIGEAMLRGDHAWLNVSDGANAIGLWVPSSLARKAKWFGSYRNTGDRVSVIGVFHRACPEHGGDMDIHVTDLTLVATGSATRHLVRSDRVAWAVFFAALAGGLAFFQRGRERQNLSSGR